MGFLLELIVALGERGGKWLLDRLRQLPPRYFYLGGSLLFLLTVAALYPRPFLVTTSFCRQLLMAGMDRDAIPLRGSDSLAINELTIELGEFLYSGYIKNVARPEGPTNRASAWETAQIAVALNGLNLPGRQPIDPQKILALFQSRRSPDCNCWKEYPLDNKERAHIGATSWVIFAKAKLGIAAEKEEIQFLLENQQRYSSWPTFPCRSPDSASTFATSWAIMALGEQERRGLITGDLAVEAVNAVSSGLIWLETNRQKDGLWSSHPTHQWAPGVSYSNSGLATFVLHQYSKRSPNPADAEWMKSLPAARARAADHESFNGMICHEESMQRDSVRYLTFPWTLIASVDAYPAGNLWKRRRAIALVQDIAQVRDSLVSEVAQEYFVAAEALIALRHLRERFLTTLPAAAADGPR